MNTGLFLHSFWMIFALGACATAAVLLITVAVIFSLATRRYGHRVRQ